MPCTIQTLSGLAKDCSGNMGGIKEVYIANFSDVSAITESTGKITAITMASSAKFKKYLFNPNTASMTSTYTFDNASGVRFVTTDLVLQFNRMDTTKRTEIGLLAQADLRVMVLDVNGSYWFLGQIDPVAATAAEAVTGTARSDKNGYSITLEEQAAALPKEILVGTGGVSLDDIVE